MAELDTFNLADIWEAVVPRVAEREALVVVGRRPDGSDLRLTYAQLDARANQLAHWMAARGVGAGQHVGLYLTNGNEYLEAMLAAYKLRAAPINVNYRYVEDELCYLFDDADLVGVIHDAGFAERVEAVRGHLPGLGWTLATGEAYEQALAGQPGEAGYGPRSSDDPYVIYTGGTTGMPKGVVWRQEDAFYSCIGGGDPMRLLGPVERPAELLDRIIDGTFVYLPVAPLMHAAGQWTALSWLFAGGKVVLLPGSLDPVTVWRTVEREQVNLLTVVGDAVVRPLLDAWDEHGPFDVSTLFSVGSGGAPLSPALRERFTTTLPNVMITNGFGSSETGAQGASRTTGPTEGAASEAVVFQPMDDTTVVLDETTLEPVTPGSGQQGRVARTGHIPLGYYNDPAKTAEVFVEVGGRRWVLTGDLATVEADGSIRLLGRGSQCINTGGEKVFPEEVEAVLKTHPDVYDVVVVGIPDERWGQAVAAVVQPAPGAAPTLETLAGHARGHLAGYKLPRSVVLVDEVVRSPAGKADYRWARQVLEGSATTGSSSTGPSPPPG
ncbi:acyl-CoA synthetase [Rhabdothermincola sediminis]|uniref:acyl-CoA synthetase n=1 Tax=Rhabdothermincola sediminis TaxID=2751370 RepID=UPI001AA06BD4|nr:acyl-CoA synthetase [Rhabdothermincola sediminis]